jgi:hypothetical protein
MRHFTNQAHARVASRAKPKAMRENSGKNPGASLATLAAGLAGNPVCMAIQMTQMVRAQKLKNSSVNQSIRAPKLRRKVGKANAAKAAIPGKASKSALSDMPVNQVATTVTPLNHKGKARCGKRQPRDS